MEATLVILESEIYFYGRSELWLLSDRIASRKIMKFEWNVEQKTPKLNFFNEIQSNMMLRRWENQVTIALSYEVFWIFVLNLKYEPRWKCHLTCDSIIKKPNASLCSTTNDIHYIIALLRKCTLQFHWTDSILDCWLMLKVQRNYAIPFFSFVCFMRVA